MNYWHMQLHPGEYRDWEINDIRNILANDLIGCSGDPVSQFYEIQINDLVLIRHGGKILSLVKVIDKPRQTTPGEKSDYVWFDHCAGINILANYEDKAVSGEGWFLPKTLMPVGNDIAYNYINSLWLEYQAKERIMELEKITSLLQYKKQIILQGPPGTGKTRLAREIAGKLIDTRPGGNGSDISDEQIGALIKEGDSLSSVVGEADYFISQVNKKDKTIVLRRSSGTEGKTSFSMIKDYYGRQLWNEPEVSSNDDRRAKAIAKYLFDKRKLVPGDSHKSERCKLIQFHSSYTYEDFVRGISSQPNENGEGILYKAENRLLGAFAEAALDNYTSAIGVEQPHSAFQNKLDGLLENVRIKIEEREGYTMSDKSTGRIIAIMEDGLLYNFPSREEIKYKVLFTDLEKVFNARDQIEKPTDLKDLERTIGLVMKGKYPYYYMLLKQLEAIKEHHVQVKKQDLKNYVLIIDEINRANLSSVLGELIYALEYRGGEVNSIYEVNGDSKLVLPPNLYIIGTMNTADRSVGHIDYAIRRRFAFVDVLPKDISEEIKDKFANGLFGQVKDLFTTDEYQTRSVYISEEFEPREVALGHSYFIDKSDEGGDIKTRWNYEIKPILLEYVRDGVLKHTVLKKIQEIETAL